MSDNDLIDVLAMRGYKVVREPVKSSSDVVTTREGKHEQQDPMRKEFLRKILRGRQNQFRLARKKDPVRKKDRVNRRIPLRMPTMEKGTNVLTLKYVGIQSTAVSSDGSGVVAGVLNMDLSTSFTYNDNGLLDDFWDEYRFVKSVVHLPLEVSYQGTSNATTSPILVAVIDYQNSGAYTSMQSALVQDNKIVLKANDKGIKRLTAQYDGDTSFVWISTGTLNDPPGYVKFYGRGWPASSSIFTNIWIEHYIQVRQRN